MGFWSTLGSAAGGANPASAIAGIGANVIGGILGNRAAKKAARVQSDAANAAAANEQDVTNRNLGDIVGNRNSVTARLDQSFADSAALYDPNIALGNQATSQLSSLIADPNSPFSTGWTGTFKAPNADDVMNSSAVQARLKLGQQAMERSAAAKGTVLGGGFQKDLNAFAQDLGSTEYGNEWNRAKNSYDSVVEQFNKDRASKFGILNDLMGSGMSAAGSKAALTTRGAEDNANIFNNAQDDITNLSTSTARSVSGLKTDAANATAAGIVGGANAISGALGSSANNLMDLYSLNKSMASSSKRSPMTSNSQVLSY